MKSTLNDASQFDYVLECTKTKYGLMRSEAMDQVIDFINNESLSECQSKSGFCRLVEMVGDSSLRISSAASEAVIDFVQKKEVFSRDLVNEAKSSFLKSVTPCQKQAQHYKRQFGKLDYILNS